MNLYQIFARNIMDERTFTKLEIGENFIDAQKAFKSVYHTCIVTRINKLNGIKGYKIELTKMGRGE